MVPVRSVLYEGALWLGHSLGLCKRLEAAGEATILCYHGVTDEHVQRTDSPHLHVPLALFEAHMRLLARQYHVVDVHTLVADLREGQPITSRTVCITFDDGYRNVVRCALPVLSALGLSACLFPTLELVGTREMHWPDVLGRVVARCAPLSISLEGTTYDVCRASRRQLEGLLKGLPDEPLSAGLQQLRAALPRQLEPGESAVVSEADLETWCAAGMSVGSHGLAHRNLSQLSEIEVRRELRESRERLAAAVGRTVSLLAYPYGRACDHNADTRRFAREEGYDAALALRHEQVTLWSDLYSLPRVVPQSLARVDAVCSGLDFRWRRPEAMLSTT